MLAAEFNFYRLVRSQKLILKHLPGCFLKWAEYVPLDTVSASVIVAGIRGVGRVTSSDHPVARTTNNTSENFMTLGLGYIIVSFTKTLKVLMLCRKSLLYSSVAQMPDHPIACHWNFFKKSLCPDRPNSRSYDHLKKKSICLVGLTKPDWHFSATIFCWLKKAQVSMQQVTMQLHVTKRAIVSMHLFFQSAKLVFQLWSNLYALKYN